MPTNWAVRLILPPKRNSWACRYWVSNRSLASRNGSTMMSAAGSMVSKAGAEAPISGGSMSARIGSAAPPGAMISSQSIRLRNWRTLPGQS